MAHNPDSPFLSSSPALQSLLLLRRLLAFSWELEAKDEGFGGKESKPAILRTGAPSLSVKNKTLTNPIPSSSHLEGKRLMQKKRSPQDNKPERTGSWLH